MPRCAIDLDAPAESLDDAPDVEQAQSSAGDGMRCSDAAKRLEDAPAILGSDADAMIDDLDDDTVRRRRQVDVDRRGSGPD